MTRVRFWPRRCSGVPNSYNGVLPTYSEDDFSLQMWSGYIQDEWRLTPKLTLESGLRYDYLNVPQILDGRISGQLDLTNQLYIVGGKQPPDCSVMQQNPCIPGGGFASVAHNSNIVFAGFNKSFLAPRSSEFEPRIGFAYAFRDSLVLRGGYGLFFDALPARSQYAQNELEAAYWPWATGFSGNTDAAGTTVTPFSSIEGHFATPVAPSSPWSIGGYYDDPHFKPPYSNQWNIELQQQFRKIYFPLPGVCRQLQRKSRLHRKCERLDGRLSRRHLTCPAGCDTTDPVDGVLESSLGRVDRPFELQRPRSPDYAPGNPQFPAPSSPIPGVNR